MAPKITHFNDLFGVSENADPETHAFLYTTFAFFDRNDAAYFGQLPKRKLQITPEEYASALERIPDAEIYPKLPTRLRDGTRKKESEMDDLYPELPSDAKLTEAPDDLPGNIYIKRPKVDEYDFYKEQDAFDVFRGSLLQEAWTLEVISRYPHPGVISYHGCRTHRGFVTGLVFDRHAGDLKTYVRQKLGPLEKEPFMEALESTARHIHSLGRAHNDITPKNILVNAAGMPVLTDFDSCLPVGKKLTYNRGTPAYTEDGKGNLATSEIHHDMYAIEKVREWLDAEMASR